MIAALRVWLPRLFWAALLTVAVWAAFEVSGAEPDPLRITALMTLVLATLWLAVGLLRTDLSSYAVDSAVESWPRGQDAGLSTWVHTIENHLASDDPNDGVRTQLASTVGTRLRRTHGFSLSDPRARDALGDELHDFLTGPRRGLRRGELDRHVERIEQL